MQATPDDELFHSHLKCLAKSTVRIAFYCVITDVVL